MNNGVGKKNLLHMFVFILLNFCILGGILDMCMNRETLDLGGCRWWKQTDVVDY